MLKKIIEATDYINKRTDLKPTLGIIAGSGLSEIASVVSPLYSFDYNQIPGFKVSSVKGHANKLIIRTAGEKGIIILQGRIHFYEGYSMEEITFPVRVLSSLGIKTLILTNASGGLNPDYYAGDLMLHTDHINLMPNPLIGKHPYYTGERFLDMGIAYDRELIQKTVEVAENKAIKIHKGCYVAVTGPTYETPAEYKYLRMIGGDVVGMSTVPEVIVARQAGIKCLAISVVTNNYFNENEKTTSHDRVLKTSARAENDLSELFKELVNIV